MLVQNHPKGPFDPKHIGDYRVISLKGNQVEVQPMNGGPAEMKHITHVKYILPANRYIISITRLFCIWKKNNTQDKPILHTRFTLEANQHIPYHMYRLC